MIDAVQHHAVQRGWDVQDIGDGHVNYDHATDDGKHTLTLEVKYTPQGRVGWATLMVDRVVEAQITTRDIGKRQRVFAILAAFPPINN